MMRNPGYKLFLGGLTHGTDDNMVGILINLENLQIFNQIISHFERKPNFEIVFVLGVSPLQHLRSHHRCRCHVQRPTPSWIWICHFLRSKVEETIHIEKCCAHSVLKIQYRQILFSIAKFCVIRSMNLALSEEQVLDGRVIDVKLEIANFYDFYVKCNMFPKNFKKCF